MEQEIEKNYKHNFIVNALDGTSFWFAYSFITPTTILPMFVSHLTNNNFFIGLIPVLSNACFLLPQLFTSNWVGRLPRKKVLPVNLGIFAERLPVMLLAPATFILAKSSPNLALLAFFILFAWHSTGAGLILVGWQDMIAKVIPPDRRGRFFGVTNFGGTITGVAGAAGVAWMLNRFVFPTGYGLSFMIAGIFIFISWVCLAMTREPAVPSTSEKISQLQYLRTLPAVLRNDRNFLRFLLSQCVIALSGMGIGFITVYATRRWQLPDSQAGNFTMVMLIGQAAANLIFGPLADRKGHKLILEISALLGVASYAAAVLAPSPTWFYLVFALRGAAFAGGMLSGIVIAFEFCAPEMRPTYIGLNNTIYGIVATVSPIIGSYLAGAPGYLWLFALSGLIGLVGFALMKWFVREPAQWL